jgi:hypothetical protein
MSSSGFISTSNHFPGGHRLWQPATGQFAAHAAVALAGAGLARTRGARGHGRNRTQRRQDAVSRCCRKETTTLHVCRKLHKQTLENDSLSLRREAKTGYLGIGKNWPYFALKKVSESKKGRVVGR